MKLFDIILSTEVLSKILMITQLIVLVTMLLLCYRVAKKFLKEEKTDIKYPVMVKSKSCDCGSGETNFHREIGCKYCC